MNAQDEKQDTVQTSTHDPFPEPQTIPSGWDTSVLASAPPSVPAEQADNSAESECK